MVVMLIATTGLSFPETSDVVLPTSVPYKNLIIFNLESRFNSLKKVIMLPTSASSLKQPHWRSTARNAGPGKGG